MKMLLLCLMLLSGARTAPTDSLLVITWNIENCFDWQCDSLSSSEIEFSSRGDRHWTRKRFEAKTGGIAKTLLAAADRFGRFPEQYGKIHLQWWKTYGAPVLDVFE